jgi:hypothetical protein
MSRLCVLLGLAVLSAALVVGTGQSGDKKEGGDPPVKAKQIQLPQGWGKLGITGEQKKKIYAVRAEYAAKIKKLQDQIDALKKEEPGELVKFLTDDQKATLRKNALEKVPEVKDKDKKGDEKKSGG